MSITVQQAQNLLDKLANGELDRGTFYLKIYELTGSPAANFQAHVSMFSGWLGGTAHAANYLMTDAAKFNDPLANEGLPATHYSDNNDNGQNEIYTISQAVALGYGAAIIEDITVDGGDGVLNILEGIDAAQESWIDFNPNLETAFPGNFLKALTEGDIPEVVTSPGTRAGYGGTHAAFMFGKSASDFAGINSRALADGTLVTYRTNTVNGLNYVVEVKLNPDGTYKPGIPQSPTLDDIINHPTVMKVVAVEDPLYTFGGLDTEAIANVFWPDNWQQIRDWEPLKEFRRQLEEGPGNYTDPEAFFASKYPDVEGGFWGALEKTFNISADDLRNDFYQFQRFINKETSTADEYLYGGGDSDILIGGSGNDTLDGGGALGHDTLTGNAGNDKFIRSGLSGLIGGTKYDGGIGTDTLDYSQLRNSASHDVDGISVKLNSAATGTAAAIGIEALIVDQLQGIEVVVGTKYHDKFEFTGGLQQTTVTFNGGLGDDEYLVSDIGNVKISEGALVGYIAPNIFTNIGHDKLDLSGLTQGVTVKNGGVELIGNTLVGISQAHNIIEFDNGTKLDAQGIEEIKLGEANDTVVTGRAATITSGTEGLHTKIDMGENGDHSDMDTVHVFGNAFIKNGTLYSQSGAEISNFEKVDLSTFNVTTVFAKAAVHTLELGYQYVSTNYSTTWLDYSGFQSGLTFNLGAANRTVGVTGDTGGQTDKLSGTISIVGTDKGDTFNLSGANGYIYLGTGNDQIQMDSSGGSFIYSGGNDVFTGSYGGVTLNSSVSLASLAVTYDNRIKIGTAGSFATYTQDIKIKIGAGDTNSILFKGGLIETVNFGADGHEGGGDDTSTYRTVNEVLLQGTGFLNLTPTNPLQIKIPIAPNDGRNDIAPPSKGGVTEGAVFTYANGDKIFTGSFNGDTILGGTGNDELNGHFGDDALNGLNGNDVVSGGAGNDTLYGGLGDDILMGDSGDDTLDGGAGNNFLSGGSGVDKFVINPGSGNDTIVDYNKADGDIIKFAFANAQNAFVPEKSGNDLILHVGNGASIENVIIKDFFTQYDPNISSAQIKSIIVNFLNEDPEMFFDIDGNLVVNTTATAGNDTFTGTNGTDTLAGLDGDDLIYAFDAADQMDGGDGDDILSGGGGNDTVVGGAGADFVMGDDGDDLMTDGTGNDTYDGGEGVDTLVFSSANGVSISLGASGGAASAADSGNDVFSNVENIVTTQANDSVTVSAGAASVNLVYVGGDDVFTLSSSVKPTISFAAGILASDIQAGSVVVDGSGHVTEAHFTISGHGTLTLLGDNLANQTVQLPGGGEYAVTATGITAAFVGTSGNDALVFSSSFHAYDGLGGNDTLDYSAVGSNTNAVLQNGIGTVSGASIGQNYLLSVENIVTGSGNDTVALSGSGRVTYSGGTDVYTLSGSGSNVHVSIADPIVAANVTVSGFVTSGGHVTSASFNVAGLGTLTLQGVELAGYTVDLSNGDQFVITAAGIEPPSTIFGTNDADIIIPTDGFKKVSALGGDDHIYFHQGIDVYDGGNGIDTLDISADTAGISLNMFTGYVSGNFGFAQMPNIEKVITGSGEDSLYGSFGDEIFQSNGGADFVSTSYGFDTIIGSIGDGNDEYDGGEDIDLLDYSSATQSVTVDLNAGTSGSIEFGSDVLTSIESVYTGSGNDTITASASGTGQFIGEGTLAGGAGNDTYNVDFTGGTIWTNIVDNAGNNTLNITASFANVTFGVDTFSENSSDLTLYASTSGSPDFSKQIVLKDWFNGSNTHPISSITVNGVLDEDSRTFTSTEIEDIFRPTAKNDVIDAHHLLGASGNVLANNGNGLDSTNVPLSTLVVTPQTLTTAHGGIVNLNSDGSFTYQGAAGYSGSDSFTYSVHDSKLLLATTATVTINNIFDQPNRPPVAVNDTFDAQGGNAAFGNVLANDSDLDQQVLTVQGEVVTTAHGGSATISENGSISYQAADGFRGTDSFSYTVMDTKGAQSTATVTISNVITNNAPVTVDDTAALNAQGFASGNVLSNDQDPDGDALTVLANTLQTANGGSVVLNANGDYIYQAATGSTGDDSFDYYVQDALGSITKGTVHISGAPTTNNSPDAKDDNINALNAASVSGNALANNGNGADSDPDGDSLSVVAQTISTAHGTVNIVANGNFTYEAAAGYRGSDSFSYTVNDGHGGTDTATVNISNIFTNRAPVAQDDQINALNGSFVAANVLLNHGSGADNDPDGDTLSVVAQTLTTANGSQVNIFADGQFNYIAAAGVRGSDSFSYTLQDGFGGTDTGLVNISNIFTNRAPVAQADQFSSAQTAAVAGNVLANNGNGADSDPDNDALSVTAQTFTTAHGGQVALLADGSFSYQAASGYRGSDSFTYSLNDAFGATATGTANIANIFTNRAPVAKTDLFTGQQNAQIAGNVLANNGNGADSDPDGDALTVAPQTLSTAQGGTVVLAQNGGFTYTPATGFFGADSFTYSLLDAFGGSATGTVNLTVNQASTNHAPDARNDDFSAFYGALISGNLLANNGSGADSDPDNNPLHVVESSIVTASGVTVSISANGNFTYTHAPDFIGTDSFTYTLSDGQGGTDTATVSLHVNTPSGAIIGTPGIDNMTGTSSADVMIGLAGNDTIGSGAGNDKSFGGSGDDHLIGGSGDDILYGETGNDQLDGGSDNDTLIGGTGNDRLIGGAGNDTLDGGTGVDTLEGGTGNDYMTGGDGNDTFSGGSGNDILISGKGADLLTGGSGANKYVFTLDAAFDGIDTITDFSKSSGDKLDINDLISFDPLHDVITNFVEITTVSGNSIVKVDADGAGTAFGMVQIATLQGVTGLTDEAALVASGNLIVS